GATRGIAVDAVGARQDRARRFGAHEAHAPESLAERDLGPSLRQHSRRGGADVVIETAGAAGALAEGLRLLRPGGRLVTAGLVVPDSVVALDASEIVRRSATIRGVHNYAPRPLVGALDAVREQRTRLPLADLVDMQVTLSTVDAALTASAERRALRPAVVPGPGGGSGSRSSEPSRASARPVTEW